MVDLVISTSMESVEKGRVGLDGGARRRREKKVKSLSREVG